MTSLKGRLRIVSFRRKNEKAGEKTRVALESGDKRLTGAREIRDLRDALIKGVRGNTQNETRLPLRNFDTTSCCGMLSNLQISRSPLY